MQHLNYDKSFAERFINAVKRAIEKLRQFFKDNPTYARTEYGKALQDAMSKVENRVQELWDEAVAQGIRADEYLELLLDEIIPAVKTELNAEPKVVMLAGYSLAGLFALYAVTKCDLFTAAASCSGSMWFPDFKEYITKFDTTKLPRTIYFSLGDREAHTKNKILQTVEGHTRAIEKHLAESGINTVFELNKGNHFQQGALRTAKGIKWILEESK